MGRRTNTARKPKGPLQSMLDREQLEEATAPLVNRFAEQHGEFDRNLRFVVNRGGTAVARWKRLKLISESQEAGIEHCQRLWAKLRSPRLVANLEGAIGGDNEGWNLHQIDALNELHRISVDFGSYWDVFENVCRHDLPAGVAGSRLANNKRSAETAARLIVCFIADMIAMRERLTY